jgi:hypothetical protein
MEVGMEAGLEAALEAGLLAVVEFGFRSGTARSIAGALAVDPRRLVEGKAPALH